MGSVYLAHDTSLDLQVAIKFIAADSAEDQAARKRLVREARAAPVSITQTSTLWQMLTHFRGFT
ncbi:MAG TPA: hypothetical protein VLD57_00285 [Blastocatellia bacterium]|nr:hypothetical protein [Blastocatellia bacterium]